MSVIGLELCDVNETNTLEPRLRFFSLSGPRHHSNSELHIGETPYHRSQIHFKQSCIQTHCSCLLNGITFVPPRLDNEGVETPDLTISSPTRLSATLLLKQRVVNPNPTDRNSRTIL